MINEGFNNDEKCLVCGHLGFCQTYWGAACKRQGGSRPPRLKSSGAKQGLLSRKRKTLRKEKLQQSKPEMFQPIRTKPVNWNLTS